MSLKSRQRHITLTSFQVCLQRRIREIQTGPHGHPLRVLLHMPLFVQLQVRFSSCNKGNVQTKVLIHGLIHYSYYVTNITPVTCMLESEANTKILIY